jgi:hypothetical protein
MCTGQRAVLRSLHCALYGMFACYVLLEPCRATATFTAGNVDVSYTCGFLVVL